MKNSFKKAWKFYLILLSILTVTFWVYMIYDDWIFVEKYGITLEDIWSWFRWYLGYCFIGFSIYYWILTTIGILIYHKIKTKKNWL